MAYNETLADRIRELLENEKGVVEKNMFGGMVFLLEGRMFCGVVKDDLMVRVIPEKYEACLEMEGCRPMDFTGKPLTGFLYVSENALTTNKQLRHWLDTGKEFIRLVPAKPKKKTKTRN